MLGQSLDRVEHVMARQPLIVLIGTSLLMEGVAFSLASKPRLNVLQLEPALIQMKDCLHCLEPDLVVFELGAPCSEALTALLNEQPEIRLAGLDLNTCQLIVLTSRQYQTDTMQDLLQVFQQQTHQQAHSLEGG